MENRHGTHEDLILEPVGDDFVALDPSTHRVLHVPGAVVQALPDADTTTVTGDGTVRVSRRRLMAGAAAAGLAGTMTSLILPMSAAAASTPPSSSTTTTTTLPPEPDATTVPPEPGDPDFDIAVTPGDGEIVVEVVEEDA